MRSQSIIAFGQPLECVEVDTPKPTGAEVLVKIEHCGVCHSDVHIHDGYFDLGGGAKLPLAGMQLPHTLGHEPAGEVVAMGPDAKGVAIGDRRAVYPWIGCGQCAACLRGEENYCPRPRNLGCSSGVGGGYSTHVMVPDAKYLIEYGNTSPALAAAYMCSGLTAYGALSKIGQLGPEDEVMVLGAGGVGMMGVQFAKVLFDKPPLVADIDEGRLSAAVEAGAKKGYNTKDAGAAGQVMADTAGGAYAVVDFVGSEATFAFASQTVRRGGKIIIVGLFGGGMAMPLPMFPMRALTIQGSYVGSLNEAKAMMAMVRSGQIDPIPVETRPLDRANDTLNDLREGKITGRVVLVP
jgi:D-arabinose 1-dehydrogenase-like Zn-dependent alcohol dehydrogenase